MKQDPQRSKKRVDCHACDILWPHGVQKLKTKKSPSMTGFLFMILVRWRQGSANSRSACAGVTLLQHFKTIAHRHLPCIGRRQTTGHEFGCDKTSLGRGSDDQGSRFSVNSCNTYSAR
ncbi:hypothetical protein V2J88_08355 [Pseudomonas alliivorans]|nr:hypothetical protein [Pseudomonas alliivorans]